jgi:hypothetical protein
MNKCERRRGAGLRQEQIDKLPRRVAIGQTEFRAVQLERFGTIALGLARPAGKNLRMVRHGDAGTVFGLKIDGGHRRLPAFGARDCGKALPTRQGHAT